MPGVKNGHLTEITFLVRLEEGDLNEQEVQMFGMSPMDQ
jgi:hypothetical protein